MTSPNNLRRVRYIGPGTIVALIAVIAIGLWNMGYLQPRKAPPTNVVPDTRTTTPVAPGIDLMLDVSANLKLSQEQITKLQSIQSEWLKESEPVARLLDQRTKELQKYMNAAGKQRHSIEDIQRHAQPMSETSAEYAQLRKKYLDRATSVLSPTQTTAWKNLFMNKRDSK